MMNVIVILDKHFVLYLFRGSFFVLFKHYAFLLNNNEDLEIATLLYYKSRYCFPTTILTQWNFYKQVPSSNVHQSFHPPKIFLLDLWDLDHQPSPPQPPDPSLYKIHCGAPSAGMGEDSLSLPSLVCQCLLFSKKRKEALPPLDA